MLPRTLAPTLQRLAASLPIVAVTGARQSGKTTLVRQLFADKPYISLEDPIERAFAAEDPRGFLQRFSQGAVFDEAQRWPDLFSHLQGMVDADRVAGRFVLTGSQHFGLMAGISQSLAGRVGMSRLLPLSLGELPEALPALDDLLLKGFYPALHHGTASPLPTDWFASYIATYVERDVRQLLRVADLGSFQRFLRLCAGRVGQLLNLSQLASETGIAVNTAKAWLAVLESSDVIFLLPPYFRNFGKRLVKTPKLYFVDVGLAAWLLGLRDSPSLALHPWRGALFENLIVADTLKQRLQCGQPADLYFWRDNNGLEADLLWETSAGLQVVEIKSGATPTSDYVRAGKSSTRFLAEESAPIPWLVYGGESSFERSGVRFVAWQDYAGRA